MWVPPKVTRELAAESGRREAEALKVIAVERAHGWVREFDAELDRIEHGLSLKYCPDPAPLDAVAQGAKPGRWHVLRPRRTDGQPGPVTLIPLTFPDGTFREPGSWVFDMLKRQDMWDDRVISDQRRRERKLDEARERREDIEREEFNQECYERWRAVSETSISMHTPRGGWSQNVAGRRGNRKLVLP